MARSSWRKWFSSASLFARRDRLRQFTRPRMELLEDRLAPAIITVTTVADTAGHAGTSLRDAITAAHAGDTIQFQSGLSGAIDLSTSEGGHGGLTLSKNLTIDGTAASITIEGGATPGQSTNAQVFVVNAGVTANLNDLTISNGYGGSGGGINNSGTLKVSNSTLVGNHASGNGGGIANFGSTVTITNSTFASNSAGNSGGGLYLDWQATATVINSTLSGNSASQGGGILNDSDPFGAYDGTLNLTNTIVANSPSGADLQELGFTNSGIALNNIIQSDPTGDIQNGTNDNQVGVDPKLSALGDYGGPTQTFALLSGSPAINAGGSSAATAAGLTTDQRGLPRVSGSAVDIGAFESQPLVVNTTADSAAPVSGQLSLRQAIADAGPGDTIRFQSGLSGVIDLSRSDGGQGVLTLRKNLTIDGTGASITIEGGATPGQATNAQVLVVNAGVTASLNDLTISNGYATYGGGIDNLGTLTVSNSTLVGNTAVYNGGGIITFSGTVTINNSTIANNSAGSAGGGIDNDPYSTTTVNDSTLSGNSAAAGGGIMSEMDAFGVGGTVNLSNTVVANSPSGSDVVNNGWTFTAQNDLIQSNPTHDIQNGVNGNIITANALLSALGNYGGPTQTFALLPGSPALDGGSNSAAAAAGLGTDQRGLARVSDGAVDIGAFESRGFSISATSGGGQSALVGSAFGQPLVATVSSGYGEPVAGGQVTFTAPASGASASLTGTPATIRASGQASVAATANGVAGQNYSVTARAAGAGAVSFTLSNASQILETPSLVVTTLADVSNPYDGLSSLREAVAYADTLPGASTITFQAGLTGTITLTGGVLTLTDTHGTMTIQGPGAALLTIDGNNASRVFLVNSGVRAVLTGLTIINGNADNGAGIRNDGNLSVINSMLVANNATAAGGAIFNDGNLHVSNCTLQGNSTNTYGGGIYSTGTLAVDGSTLSHNTAGWYGGGIQNTGGTLWVNNSTFFADSVPGYDGGGGIDNDQGTAYLTSTTLSGNTAYAGGGIYTYYGTLYLTNTIVANSIGTSDVFGAVASAQNSLIQSPSGYHNVQDGVNGNIVGKDPLLSAPGNYGGPTQTLALLPGSPALDAGSNSAAAAAGLGGDQRGFPRVINGTADIGAFESHGFAIYNYSGNGQSARAGSAFSQPLVVAVGGNYGEPVVGGQVTFTAPASGASASLTGTPATIMANGLASVTATANSIFSQNYSVTASATGTGAVTFTLSNTEAPSLVVTTLLDVSSPYDGYTSLREAIAYANTLTGPTTITFQAGLTGTITLTGGVLTLNDTHGTMTIQGPGANLLTIDGNNNTGVFQVNGGVSAVLDSLTIARGSTSYTSAIYIYSGTLTVSNCTLSNNSGGYGGIYNYYGTLTVSNSTLSHDSANSGGGIYNYSGTVTLSNATLSNDSARYGGGAIYSYSGQLTVSNTTFTNDSAATNGGQGGAVWSQSGTLTVGGSTFSGNSAQYGGALVNGGTAAVSGSTFSGNSASVPGSGGGIYNFGTLTVGDSTFSGNSSYGGGGGIYNNANLTVSSSTFSGSSDSGSPGGAIFNNGGTLSLANTILANSVLNSSQNSVPDLYNAGGLGTFQNNLIQAEVGNVLGNGANGNIVGQNPLLSPLGYYGGPTETFALLPGSRAIDAGSNALIANDPATGHPYTTDQRGQPRITGGRVDIGAFEVQPPNDSVSLSSSSGSSVAGQDVTFALTVSPIAPATGTPTGVVQWQIDGQNIAPAILTHGQSSIDTAGLSVGSHTITAIYSGDATFTASSATFTQTVAALSSGNLQSVINGTLPTNPTTGHPTAVLNLANQSQVSTLLGILASTNSAPLTAPVGATTPIDIAVSLPSGAQITEADLSVPSGFRLSINGGTWIGGSPALTFASGDLTISNATFTNDTDAPTILVTGGSLTLRNDTIQESTGFNDAAISVTGGTLNLGTPTDRGGNTLNVNGAGRFIDNSTPNSVPSYGNTFELNGALLTTGMLDPTFGDGGKVLTPIANSQSVNAQAVAVQPDGKIIAVGTAEFGGVSPQFTLARYNADGSLDTSFGNAGIASVGNTGTDAYGVALQADGKIVVVGDNGLVDRFNGDGSRDTTFGIGGQKQISFFGSYTHFRSVAIQADGRIVVAGYVESTGGPYGQQDSFAVARLNGNDGSLDRSFDHFGTETINVGQESVGTNVAVQTNGQIVIGGYSYHFAPRADGGYESTGEQFAAVRLNGSDGSLDTSFGTGGEQTVDFGYPTFTGGMALQSDGKIVMAGSGPYQGAYHMAVARLNGADGSLDGSFGTGGLLSASTAMFPTGLAIQADGRILVGGNVSSGSAFVLDRLNSDGSADSSFGRNGEVTTSFGRPYNYAAGVALQPDGKAVLAGISHDANTGTYQFALARYLPVVPEAGPTADAGGPYTIALGAGLTLDASASNDADGDTLTYSWTVNGRANIATSVQPHLSFWQLGITTIGSYTVSVTVYDGNGHTDTQTTALNVVPATPEITWLPPAYILAGTPLGAAQLDAKASAASGAGLVVPIPGTFTYTPAAGTVLGVGDGQTLSVHFVPDNPDYAPADQSVTINVLPAPPSTLSGPDQVDQATPYSLTLGPLDADPNHSIQQYTIHWGDGTSDTYDGTTQLAQHSYPIPGPYQISADVTLRSVFPDPSFGGGTGVVLEKFPDSFSHGNSVAVDPTTGKLVQVVEYQPDGGSPAGNPMYLVRYNADGTVDTTFGNGTGILSLSTYLHYGNSFPNLAIDSAGRLLLSGGLNDPFLVARLNADGSLDTSFGSGGFVPNPFPNNDYSTPLTLDSQGRIILSRTSYLPDGTRQLILIRLNPDGSFDPSFGGGTGMLAADPTIAYLAELAADPTTGDLFATRYDSGPEVVRLNPDGSLDPSFADGGVLPLQFDPAGLALDAQGRLIVSGSGQTYQGLNDSSAVVLARFQVVDPGAPLLGVATKTITINNVAPTVTSSPIVQTGVTFARYANAFGNGADYTFAAQATDAQGRTYVPGLLNDGQVTVTRYNPDGSMDTSFGTGGTATSAPDPTNPNVQYQDSSPAVALDSQGRIVETASYYDDNDSNDVSVLARFLPDGTPDTTFGDVTIAPNAAGAGTVVTLAGNFSDPGGSDDAPYSYTWIVSDDKGDVIPGASGTVSDYTGSVPDISYTTAAGRSYTITLSVADKNGAVGTSTTTMTVAAPTPSILGQQPRVTLSGVGDIYGVAIDAAGNRYVAESGPSDVAVFAPGSTTPTSYLTGITNPTYFAFDKAGDLFVAGSFTSDLWEFAPGSTTPTATLSGVNLPQDLIFDANGNLFVSNAGDNTVSEYAPGSTAPTATLTGLNQPYALAFDSSGDLFITNPGNDTVSEFAPGSTTPTATLTGLSGAPYALAIDATDNVFVGNYESGTVSEFAAGSTTPTATLIGADWPDDMGFDAAGNLIVLDRYGTTASVFAPGATTPTATLPGLNAPLRMGFDAQGNLYVTNYGSSTVSEFGPISPPSTANAGSPVTLSGNFAYPDGVQGAPFTYTWSVSDNNGDVVLGATGQVIDSTARSVPDFAFTPSRGGTYTVTLTVTDQYEAASQPATATIVVPQPPLTVSVSGPSRAVVGQALTFTLNPTDPTDPTPSDQAGTFTYAIDWDGDGTFDQTVTGPAGMTVTHTFATAGSDSVQVAATNQDGTVSPTSPAQTVAVADVSSPAVEDVLSGPLPTDPRTGHPTVTLAASTQAQADAIVALFQAPGTPGFTPLQRPAGAATPIDLVITLDPSVQLHEASLAVPQWIRVQINGGTWYGGSPALTFTSGDLTITGATFLNDTDAPTILVTGGSLTLRNDTVQESTSFNDAAIAVTGGNLDLGTFADAGNNIVNINGAGQFLQNASGNAIPAIGDTFTNNGALVPNFFTVLNTANSGPGSLRQAIKDANTSPNNAAGPDLIQFAIGAGGVQSIAPLSALPTISDAVILDGTTQPGYSGTPLIELNGSSAGSGANGLSITAGNSMVRGLVIDQFGQNGIYISGGGGDLIAANYIGTDVSGMLNHGNAIDGIRIESSGNTIGGLTATPGTGAGNVISGNKGSVSGAAAQGGISIGSANNNLVEGNLVGTTADGSGALGNSGFGIIVLGTSTGNTIGGTAAGAGNIASGNGRTGITLTLGATGNSILGNSVGTDIQGKFAIGNVSNGILITQGANGNTIDNNVVSGNAVGVNIISSSNNVVQGNFIGTDYTGTVALGNFTTTPLVNGAGVAIQANVGLSCSNNLVGGTTAAARNIIAGNQETGVWFNGGVSGNFLEGNYIGVNAAGAPLGNTNDGVRLWDFVGTNQTGPKNNTLTGNVIANNGLSGITLRGSDTTGNRLSGNSIYNNGGLGIDLGGDGVTANTPGGPNVGPNDLQNYPVLTAATTVGSSLLVAGTLNSAASTTFTIEVFATPTADPSGHGQGQYDLGTVTVTTDASGNAGFATDLSAAALPGGVVPAAWAISATATDPSGNTSEFSADVPAATGQTPAQFLQQFLQATVPAANAGLPTAIFLQCGSSITPSIALAAVSTPSLGAPAVHDTISVNLAGGTYVDGTASSPANVLLVIHGAPHGHGSTGTTYVGHSPAFTIGGGAVVLDNITFQTDTDAPTVLVTGGSVTLSKDVVQSSTSFADPAVAVTGGTLALVDSTLNVNTAGGQFVQNTTPNPITTTGSTFAVSGTVSTAPTFVVAPSNLTLEATSPAGAVATYTATAADTVDGTDPVVFSILSGSTFPLGTTTVTYSATNSAGLTSSGSFAVTVRDTIAPVTTVPSNVTLTATYPGSVSVSLSATDGGSGVATTYYKIDSRSYTIYNGAFAVGGGGTHTVSFYSVDRASNAETPHSVSVVIARATPSGTVGPDNFTYGKALAGSQLGTSLGGVAGTFSFGSAEGTILDAGSYTESYTFTPTDTADYSSVTGSVAVTVARANQTISWSNPAPIIYGTPLGATQLNASVSVIGPAPAGALTYTPAAGTVLSPGLQTLSVAAAATNDYDAATATVTISVGYGFSGFLAPLNTSQALGLGRTIPIKFQLTAANGTFITNLSAITSLKALNSAGTDVLAGAGKTSLRYDSTANQFVNNWSTKGLTAGTYTLTLALADGTIYTRAVTLSPNGAFQLTSGASSDYVSSTAHQILYGDLTVAVQDDTGAGIDPSELARINDAMAYLNSALGAFGVDLTWAASGTAADVVIHLANSTPEGSAADGVLGFTTADNDVYLVEGWNFSTAADPTQVGAGQYDFQTLATHELAHTVGLGESSDPGSVMYEYLSPGTARRTFTDGNLTAINTDADRFMKVGRDALGRGAVAAGRAIPVVPAADVSADGLAAGTGRVSTWGPVRIDLSLAPATLPELVGGGWRADLPGEGGHDILTGGAGDDMLVGGAGQDLLVGGFAANAPAGAAQEAGDATRDKHGAAAAAAGATSAGAAVADALPASAGDGYFLQAGSGVTDMPNDPGVP
jgi:uncharacterized delta-60 repeat protein/CSLREA domain-containing protein